MAVILYQSELPVFFSYKEKWSGIVRGRPSNGSPRKVFFDKFSQLVVFFRAQGIYLGGLWFERRFEVDCVIPEGVFGESLQSSFTEDIEVSVMCLGNTFL